MREREREREREGEGEREGRRGREGGRERLSDREREGDRETERERELTSILFLPFSLKVLVRDSLRSTALSVLLAASPSMKRY